MPKIKVLVWSRFKLSKGPHVTYETEGPVVYDDAAEMVTFPDVYGDTGRFLSMQSVERLELHLEQ